MQWMEEEGLRCSAVDGGRRVEIQCSGWRKEGL